MEAARVPTPAVRNASISDIGVAVVSWLPQDARSIPINNNMTSDFLKYILTSFCDLTRIGVTNRNKVGIFSLNGSTG